MKGVVHYPPGTVRWRRHNGKGDVRGHRVPGWDIEADLLTEHPITGKPLPSAQWWFKETKRSS